MNEHIYARDRLTLAAAGMLSPAEQRRVEAHLDHCEECRNELDEWAILTGALKELPIPQAPPRLVIQTQRLLSHAAAAKKSQASQLGLALLVVFSWMVAFMTVGFVRVFDLPLARWLDLSSTTLWIIYIGITWLATALAAGLLGKHWQREGRTI
jgi:predicted anti-sigma-YlaC factor YlaD